MLAVCLPHFYLSIGGSVTQQLMHDFSNHCHFAHRQVYWNWIHGEFDVPTSEQLAALTVSPDEGDPCFVIPAMPITGPVYVQSRIFHH